MNSDVKISLFGTAIRVSNWIKIYKNTVLQNNITMEIVFCGNKKPNFSLPKNFKFIFSNVKPVQCLQIALNNTSGELVFAISDDLIFTKNLYDKLYNYHINTNNKNIIVGTSFKRENYFYSDNDYKLIPGSPESPQWPVNALILRKDIMKIGGFDKSFIAVNAIEDLYLRLMEKGFVFLRLKELFIEEETIWTKKNIFKRIQNKLIYFFKKYLKYTSSVPDVGSNLFPKYGYSHDFPLLKSFWIPDDINKIKKEDILFEFKGMIQSKKRLVPFNSFENKNLLDISQGSKGHWN